MHYPLQSTGPPFDRRDLRNPINLKSQIIIRGSVTRRLKMAVGLFYENLMQTDPMVGILFLAPPAISPQERAFGKPPITVRVQISNTETGLLLDSA